MKGGRNTVQTTSPACDHLDHRFLAHFASARLRETCACLCETFQHLMFNLEAIFDLWQALSATLLGHFMCSPTNI